MSRFKYAGIETFDINNGTGFGVTLFVQGCTHHCSGCHNPSTWDFDGGKDFDHETFAKLRDALLDPNIKRFTISGGEPFDNYCAVCNLCHMFKAIKPEKQLWIYTGYTYEELIAMGDKSEVLDMCDVLVDGEFEIDKKDLSLPFRGSSNQRVIDLKATKEKGTIITIQFEGDIKNDAT